MTKSPSQTERLLMAGTPAMLGLSLLGGAFAIPSVYADPIADSQARFSVIVGTVDILSQGAKDWVSAHEGLPIEPGDRIRTDEESRVELAMSDAALWLLEPQSEMVAEYNDVNSGRFDLVQGVMLGKVDAGRAGGPQQWQISTPGADCLVHGTAFAIHVSEKQIFRFIVMEGDVDIQPAETADGQVEPFRLSAGHEVVVTRGKPLQLLKTYGADMAPYARREREMSNRLTRLQNIWSPYTVTYREEFRKKFIAAPPKPRPIRHPVRKRPKSESSDGSSNSDGSGSSSSADSSSAPY